jgi:hypothetical protein
MLLMTAPVKKGKEVGEGRPVGSPACLYASTSDLARKK